MLRRHEDKQLGPPAPAPTPREQMAQADAAYTAAVHAASTFEFAETPQARAARARSDAAGQFEQLRAEIERCRMVAAAAHVRFYNAPGPPDDPDAPGPTVRAERDAQARHLRRLAADLRQLGITVKEVRT